MTKIDSQKLLVWINLITSICNQISAGKHFQGGFNLCFLQQCMVEIHKELEKQEKHD